MCTNAVQDNTFAPIQVSRASGAAFACADGIAAGDQVIPSAV